MRKLVVTITTALALSPLCGAGPAAPSSPAAQPPAPLTHIDAIRALTKAEAGKGYPVDIEATVTYCRSHHNHLFVQNGVSAIYVDAGNSANLAPGDRIEVRGISMPGYRPYIKSREIEFLSHGEAPSPLPQPSTT